tara:strand:+ start:333 stop:608 length:276 start_codon:yes stop_codon:yes gene_type:complete
MSKTKLKKSFAAVSAKKQIREYAEKNNSYRISTHEKVCAERMKTLFKAIDEMRVDIKNLHSDMNKGKGVISFLIIIGGLIGAVISFFKWNG